MKVIFFSVKTNAAKMERICTLASQHFQEGKKLLITAPNEEAARYLDLLLWRLPEDSFLPHGIQSEDPIAITWTALNCNQAQALLNLKGEPVEAAGGFACVFELDDQTTPEKAEASKRKREQYTALNVPCEVI